jgi:hypothetical protein
MMTRRELRAARLADDERSRNVASGERFPDALAKGTGVRVDAAQPNVEESSRLGSPTSQTKRARTTGVTHAPTTLEELREAPITAHPFRVFLVQRECSIECAAAIVGVTRKTIGDWLAYRSRPTPRRSAEIARLLGFGGALDDDLRLFPLPPLNAGASRGPLRP